MHLLLGAGTSNEAINQGWVRYPTPVLLQAFMAKQTTVFRWMGGRQGRFPAGCVAALAETLCFLFFHSHEALVLVVIGHRFGGLGRG